MSDCSSLGGPFHWHILSHNSLQGRHSTWVIFYFYSAFVCERKVSFLRTARSWCWLARHRDYGVSWRKLGLHNSDCQDKLRDSSVHRVPFAGCARHPSLQQTGQRKKDKNKHSGGVPLLECWRFRLYLPVTLAMTAF